MAKEKTVKMWFHQNMYYNDLVTPIYEAGKEYDVPERMASRWLKRGGIIVAEQPVPPPAPAPAPVHEPVKVPEPIEPPVQPEDGKPEKEKEKDKNKKNK